ncbi:MAG: acyl-CoA dehydrogenase family protein [Acidimicrobiales bacterium]
MNFDDSPAEAAFRRECREFLDRHAELKPDRVDWSQSYWARPPSDDEDRQHVVEAQKWQRIKYDAGWVGLSWPEEYGGRGLSPLLNRVFHEEESRYEVPGGMFAQSIGMAGPTIIALGTDAQKAFHLDPMLTGDHIWCQLFSEPEAGSDLAGLRTAALRDGDEFVVNGQKVWTSSAQHAQWGMLLVRTDVDAPKHRGITYLLVDMSTPGIEIRPLRQITGASHFNEVFLTDVRVPVANVVGDINGGWGPILTTLANERTGIGTAKATSIDDLIELARHFGVADDPVVRDRLMQVFAMHETIRFMGYRAQTAAGRGEAPGPESSVLKLAATRRLEAEADLTMAIMGVAGTLIGDDAHMAGFWQNYSFLGQWMSRIGGGTDQVQRNIVGENVLGLAQEPRLDKGVAFRDIPR